MQSITGIAMNITYGIPGTAMLHVTEDELL